MSKNFYLLMSSRVFSNIGDSIFYILMMWYIYTNYQSEYWLGLAGVMFSLPSIIGFFWGPIIDKYSPKHLYIIVSTIQFLLILLFAIVQFIATPGVYFILLFILLISITSELTYPIESVMIPRVVNRSAIYKANSYMSVSNNTVDMLSNGLGGIMVAILSFMAILNINMLLFLLPLLFMSMIQLKKNENHEDTKEVYSFSSSLKEGFKFTFKRKILNLVLPLTIINFTFSIVLVSLPIFADQLNGPEVYGLILMAFGVGSIVGALLVNNVLKVFDFKTLVILCFFSSGLAWLLMVYVVNESIIFTLLLITISYIFIGMINVMYTTLFQILPQEKLIGRVNTIVESLISMAMPLGSFIGGVLLTKYNVNDVMSIFGLSLFVISILYIVLIKKGDYDAKLILEKH